MTTADGDILFGWSSRRDRALLLWDWDSIFIGVMYLLACRLNHTQTHLKTWNQSFILIIIIIIILLSLSP